MKSFKDISYTTRLQVLILAFTAAVLAAASLGFLALETAREHQRLTDHFAVLAALSSTSLAVTDGPLGEAEARRLLDGLASDASIQCALVWDGQPRLLAAHRRGDDASGCPDSLSSWREQAARAGSRPFAWMAPALYLAPVTGDDHTLGWIAFRSAPHLFRQVAKENLPLLLPGAAVLLLLLFPLSAAMARRLGNPVQRLMAKVAGFRRGDGDQGTLSLDALERLIEETREENASLARENRRLAEEARAGRIATERAEKDARTALLSQRRLLRTLNRDIRLPMSSLLGIVELLLDSNLDARAGRLARTLHQSVENLLEVVQQTFDRSRGEASDPVPEEEEFDLRRLVEEAVRPSSSLAPHRGVKLRSELSASLPERVVGDPLRLSQLLEGMLQSAFRVAHGGEIHFKARQKEAGGTLYRVEFRVCLRGEEIPHDQRAMFFDSLNGKPVAKLELLEPQNRDLVISNRLAELLGGSFELAEDLEGDPCFILDLPLKRTGAAGRADTPAEAARPTSGARVLLVEDNEVNQMITMSMLKALDCEVELAKGGEEAVTRAGEQRFDLIFMDCHMPGTDGFTASRRIREHERSAGRERTPIIALTADVHDGVRERCQRAGMDDYISKPYSREDLARALTRWLPGRESPETASAGPAASPQREQVLDKARLDSLRSTGHERGASLLEKAARYYIDHTPEELGRLRQAIEDGMAEQIRLIAHNLKSSSDMLGAAGIAREFGRLEKMALEHRLEKAPERLQAAERMLPVVVEALEEAIQADDSQVSPASERVEANGRILLVDDDPAFRLVTAASLREAGFVVEEATNGNDALAAIAADPPELILLDALMEDIDGFEICTRIQQDPETRQIPVLMVTGLDDIDSVHKAFQAGAAGFITKPVNYPVLIHRIRFQLRVARESVELRESREQLAMAQQLARLGHWRWEPAKARFEMSEQLARICELDLDRWESSLENFVELVDPEDREQLRLNIRMALEEGSIKPLDYRIVTAGGRRLYIHQELTMPAPGTLLGTVQDITRQYESEQKIRKLAYSDELTGLASRSYFQRHLEDTINIAERHQEKFSLLYLDLDSFKDINDTLGHDVGDELLKVVAERLSKVLRKTDFAARLGGDEFCILMDNVSINYAAEIASRCLEEVNKPIRLGAQTFNPRISIGIANFPGDGRDAQTLLKAADSAMYAAKQEGKHRYAFYQPELTLRAKRRLDMEHELREALEKEELELHYQPQISLATGRIFGVEALVRWKHPTKGLVPPGEFIHVAERIGLIKTLGKWVLETACQQARQWVEAGHQSLQVAINISPLHFKDPAIVQQVREALDRSGCSAANLELEVTESVVQTEPDNMENFRRLKELGVRIAIDDFGTGYSSLASLKKLPIDCLKVDQLFIRGMVDEPESATLVGTIIGLAKALGLHVVAEGVENEQEVQILTGLGCDIVQGYYFSRPVTADEIPALLERDFVHPASIGQIGLAFGPEAGR